jgi:hypothetical protein
MLKKAIGVLLGRSGPGRQLGALARLRLRLPVLEALAQNLLVELAHGGLRHRLDKAHLVGQPPLGDQRLEVVEDLALRELPFELGRA